MKYKTKVIWYYIEIGFTKILNILKITKDASVIPYGMYCYKFDGRTGIDERGYTWHGTKTCKYYRHTKNGRAGCTFVGYIGYDACLTDQCKICGENNEIKEEDLI